jgi:elongation factor 1-gamma
LGKNAQEYAQILKWLSFANGDVLPTAAMVFKPLIGDGSPYNKKSVEDHNAQLEKQVAMLESRLYEYTYLVSERLTFADIYVAIMVNKPFTFIWGTEWRKKHPNITRWYKTIISTPIVAAVLPDFKFVDKPVEYVPPKKENKEKAAKKEKAPKAAAASKPAADEPPAQAPKPKHPLEALGRPKAPLDEWKRTYSNEETREVALPWFWKNQWDPEEWSLWKVDYRYNDELTLTFMSNNLVGGFFNRLSASTKYMFGCMVVYGENNNNGITGAFLVRGQEHEPAFNVAPDWESYSFSKLDGSNEQDREFVDNMWAWDKPVIVNGENKEIADGKVFK